MFWLAGLHGDSPANMLLRMVGPLDDNTRNLTRALVRVVSRAAAQVRQDIAAGRLHDADLIPDLVAAVEEISRLKDSGVSIPDYPGPNRHVPGWHQRGETRDLIQFMQDNIRRPAKLPSSSILWMAWRPVGNPNQGSLLGELAPEG